MGAAIRARWGSPRSSPRLILMDAVARNRRPRIDAAAEVDDSGHDIA
jgi:hypothetical protein